MTGRPRVAVVDHADSFTYNLVHALDAVGATCRVVRHDVATIAELLAEDGVLLSAGPCSPRETGVTVEFLKTVIERGGPPVLGVCLGHQCIAYAVGAPIERASRPLHGKVARVRHDGDGLFAGCPNPMVFARYNSLSVGALPSELVPCAWDEDGQLMALRHRTRRIDGVQFHPESHLSVGGELLFRNWVRGLGRGASLRATTG